MKQVSLKGGRDKMPIKKIAERTSYQRAVNFRSSYLKGRSRKPWLVWIKKLGKRRYGIYKKEGKYN